MSQTDTLVLEHDKLNGKGLKENILRKWNQFNAVSIIYLASNCKEKH